MGLKENHPAFCKEVEEYFDATQKEPQNYSDIKSKQTIDFGHGHIETRTYYLTTETIGMKGRTHGASCTPVTSFLPWNIFLSSQRLSSSTGESKFSSLVFGYDLPGGLQPDPEGSLGGKHGGRSAYCAQYPQKIPRKNQPCPKTPPAAPMMMLFSPML